MLTRADIPVGTLVYLRNPYYGCNLEKLPCIVIINQGNKLVIKHKTPPYGWSDSFLDIQFPNYTNYTGGYWNACCDYLSLMNPKTPKGNKLLEDDL
jgi:hypothetical protein